MAPLNHQYGFLSSPSPSNQHLDWCNYFSLI
jgi:hypothetical protein